jgi:hypothetical protein
MWLCVSYLRPCNKQLQNLVAYNNKHFIVFHFICESRFEQDILKVLIIPLWCPGCLWRASGCKTWKLSWWDSCVLEPSTGTFIHISDGWCWDAGNRWSWSGEIAMFQNHLYVFSFILAIVDADCRWSWGGVVAIFQNHLQVPSFTWVMVDADNRWS